MDLVKMLDFGSVISSMWDKFSPTLQAPINQIGADQDVDATAENNVEREREEVNNRDSLRFHAIHGIAITLHNNSSLATRNEGDFERSVVFSHRPVTLDEIIVVKIEEMDALFHGPLRIGFTSFDPADFPNHQVPLGRDLKNQIGFWMKSLQLFPLDVGTMIYFKLCQSGTVLYRVNDENGGTFLKDIDVSRPVWAVFEAYGSVQSFSLVDIAMINGNRVEARLVEPGNDPFSRLARNLRNLPLNLRRNVDLPPLENAGTGLMNNPLLSTSPIMSPTPSSYLSPLPINESSVGLCIVCVDNEKNSAFTTCGHLCMCYECAQNFKNQVTGGRKNLCPVCRRPITSILRIYF